MKIGNGFVYVATGEGYRDEALKSAATLKRSHPGVQICLVTDKTLENKTLFDDVVVVESESVTFSPLDKTLAVRCPYERAVFLDTDTEEYSQISPIASISSTARGYAARQVTQRRTPLSIPIKERCLVCPSYEQTC